MNYEGIKKVVCLFKQHVYWREYTIKAKTSTVIWIDWFGNRHEDDVDCLEKSLDDFERNCLLSD